MKNRIFYSFPGQTKTLQLRMHQEAKLIVPVVVPVKLEVGSICMMPNCKLLPFRKESLPRVCPYLCHQQVPNRTPGGPILGPILLCMIYV